MKLRKYSFASLEAWNTAKAAIVQTDEEGNESYTSNVHSVGVIGHLVETPAVIDGEVEQEAILTSTYHIDIVWNGEPMFEANIVWCAPMGQLIIGSMEVRNEWVATCKDLHPEYFPEPSEDLV